MKIKLKFFQLILLILMIAMPFLTLMGCKVFYDKKDKEANEIIRDDFISYTSKIGRAFVLREAKQWDPNYVISYILDSPEGYLKYKDNAYSYFGKTYGYNWKPDYKDFIAPEQKHHLVSDKSYEKPYENLMNQNRLFDKIKTVLTVINSLTPGILKQVFNNDESMYQIIKLLTAENIDKVWEFYNKVDIKALVNVMDKSIADHDAIIGNTFENALQWSSFNIKKMLLNIGCQELETEKYCKLEDDKSDTINKVYTLMIREFFYIKLVDVSKLETEFIFNEKIKSNFLNSFKKYENIINLAVFLLPVISYILSVFDEIKLDDVTRVFNENNINNEDSMEKKDIIDPIQNQLKLQYQGFNEDALVNWKTKLINLTNLTEDGLGLRKILLILELTPSLKSLIEPFEIIYDVGFWGMAKFSILNITAFNTLEYIIIKKNGIFNQLWKSYKLKIEPYFDKFNKYLDYIPDSANNLSLNISIFWNKVSKLLKSINEVLTLENINKLKEVVAKNNNEDTLQEIFRIIGFKDYNILEDGLLDEIIKFKDDPEVAKIINLFLDKEDCILGRIINKNNDEINENFLHWVLKDDYWEIENKVMNYDKNSDTLEVSYYLRLITENVNKKYHMIWKNKNYYALSYKDFKITTFKEI